ncbi:endonuclease [Candidatus Roizmanbacteria bacterium RIFCSPLOWO2_01_FULL_38_12]|uniref:Endonuclease n=1 Tax=Candidatus Roizmanbacteria bacterium RIFCSPLOWO2_01_FULL_38_12 TaxID=1802061 RepID=A0A1F7IZY9_9BACT|nr:MAG: endonuclease [Candidatus Roizmanbacteria bacterium RIFCSPHIGHO2_01_FULL_38_15]OGK35740.1 MAG: endonuclease [Candidatus Roizmanbacteria bacterium RIFCSPHIGHO2_12_FULL_38_13]OGK48930.1 MAG: endonuclease [Candidatus Roizmanbacteria bacterium RIFCSPLOWO2_01_FULL_38_12]
MKNIGFIYILTSQNNTIFYIGVTENLIKRIFEHKQKKVVGFTQKYNLTKLVYYEYFENIVLAIKREKQLKNWHRDWKINLIKQKNPDFRDLFQELVDAETDST